MNASVIAAGQALCASTSRVHRAAKQTTTIVGPVHFEAWAAGGASAAVTKLNTTAIRRPTGSNISAGGRIGATRTGGARYGMASIGHVIAKAARVPALGTAAMTFAVVSSHSLLDTLTDGGLGCALLWPFSSERFFAPWRPLPVAPIGRAFLSGAGLRVAAVELIALSPLLLYALWPAPKPRGQR